MNKPNLQAPPVYPIHAEPVVSAFPPIYDNPSEGRRRHLIVLVPDEAGYTPAMRRVWKLAHTTECQVLFLSLCSDETKESSLRRQLITLCAMAQNDKVHAEGQIETGSNWVRAVQAHLREGDLLVCFDEQISGLTRRPLSQVLESSLHTPVYILSGLPPQAQATATLSSRLAAWAGLLAIVAGAFLLQVHIVTQTTSWVQTSLLLGSVLGELWLIWRWNSLFR